VKIGYLAPDDVFAEEMFNRLKAERAQDEFLRWLPGDKAPATDLEVLISNGKVAAEQLDGLTKLGLLQTASAGYESVDVEAATKLGIWVGSAPTTRTGNGESVAEFAMLLMLGAGRRLNEELAWTRADEASRQGPPEGNKALFGSTVCVVGLGGIGQLLVERLRGFGVTLIGVDTHPEHAPADVRYYHIDQLKEAVAEADFVVLAVPGSKENENLIDADVLASMKKGSVLVNVGRGTLVDEPALLAAVKSGHLYGAGLDVVKHEPVDASNPLLTEARILVTPHSAGSTDVMLAGTVAYLAEVLARYEQGLQPEGVVNEPKEPRVPLRTEKRSVTDAKK
jgi:phosphoglycerate dehydrogenase-like enzyme